MTVLGMLSSCAAPMPPQPPSENVPEAVTDLVAQQVGTSVVLHFTLPDRSTTGASLAGPWRIEIDRHFLERAGPIRGQSSGQNATAAPGSPTFTLRGRALLDHVSGNLVSFKDALGAKQFSAHPGRKVVYYVRTAAGQSGWSAFSKAASLTLVAPPTPPRDLTAKSSEGTVRLDWTSGMAARETFIIYRTELSPNGARTTAPVVIVRSTGTSYQDTTVQTGQRYRYAVRATERAENGEVESVDSNSAVIQVPAVSAPAPPRGLAAIPVRNATGSLEVDLSWAISSEDNLSGYNVYRRRLPNGRGRRLNHERLLAPAFRDRTVAAGVRYLYWVTAVDAAGIESPPSKPVTVRTPASGAVSP